MCLGTDSLQTPQDKLHPLARGAPDWKLTIDLYIPGTPDTDKLTRFWHCICLVSIVGHRRKV